ncbi:winged helix-turn-helix domain-containing protein [Vibrio splendidus]|uniref:winged helix-turn-helix domain-containing protein n=1 Tax=Vibrio splendidus TaxID=29497 RepID=UPI00223618B2|nr:winged helix-turn-helix domain-containing protein [Vibrio splendidus]MCW4438862.1 winged helix-turn-helix domain-containing protein [Vibrio splendidus]
MEVDAIKVTHEKSLTEVPYKNAHLLSELEYKTLLALYEKVGEVVSKNELEQKVWGSNFVAESSVSVIIYKLRSKLKHDGRIIIKTVHGKGYTIEFKESFFEKNSYLSKKINVFYIVNVAFSVLFFVVIYYLYFEDEFKSITCLDNRTTLCYIGSVSISPLNLDYNLSPGGVYLIDGVKVNRIE